MRWEDEPYIKNYTRDTPEFLALTWQARGLFHEILRKVDRAGVMKVGKLGPVKGLAVVIQAPAAEIEPFVEELLEDGRIVFDAESRSLLVPNHIEAQGATQSDAARKRRSRETARALFGTADVTNRDDRSQNVTESHERSRAVTLEEKRSEETRSEEIPPTRVRAVRDLAEVQRDGVFGLTAVAWRDGMSIATGGPVAALSRVEQTDLQRMLSAHAGGRSGEELLAWVRETALAWGRTGDPRFGLTVRRAIAWLDAKRPAPTTLARGRPRIVQPGPRPNEDDWTKRMNPDDDIAL